MQGGGGDPRFSPKPGRFAAPRDPRPGCAARRGAARRAAVALPFPSTQCVVPGSTPTGAGRGVCCAVRGFQGPPRPPWEIPAGARFGRGRHPGAGGMLSGGQRLRSRRGGGDWAPVKGPARHGKKGPALSLARPARLTNSTAANDILERLFRAQVTPNPRKTLQ